MDLLQQRTPSPVTRRVQYAALSVASQQYDAKLALEIYAGLKQDGTPVELLAANLAITACSHNGDLETAMSILQELQVRCRRACRAWL